MKHHARIGEIPQWAPKDKFNTGKWLQGKHGPLSNVTNATVPGYRERRAKQLLAQLDAGKLAPSASAGVERDYKSELAKLRKGRNK